MKNKTKTRTIFALFMILLFVIMPIVIGLEFNYVNINTTKTTAEFEWQTDDTTNYKLEYSKQGSSTWLSISNDDYLITNIATITNLEDDTNYDYKITAKNVIGTLKIYQGAFKTKDGTPPAQIENLYSSSQTDSSIHINWQASTEQDISHYSIYVNTNWVGNTTNIEYNITDLIPSTEYLIGVSAIDTSGNKAIQTEITERTAIPDYPAIFNTNIQTLGLTATFTWDTFREGDTIVSYGTTETLGSEIKIQENTFNHEIRIEDLISDTSYYYILKSCNEAGCGETNIKNFTSPVYEPVFIELEEFSYLVNTHEFELRGNTTSNSKITAYSGNNINAQTTANEDGRFVIYLRLREGENNINLVAEDIFGITTEKQITIYSDTTPPQIEISELPEIITDANSILTITPSEFVDLKIYIIPEIYDANPPMPQNLIAENQGNEVIITWDELKNEDGSSLDKLSEIVVMRDGKYIGKVDGSKTTFTDTKVGPSKEYSYFVFAVSNYCKFSGTSKTARVITSNTIENNEEPSIKEYECEKIPDKQQQTGGMIQFNFRSYLKEGKNKILIEAVDETGNSFEQEYEVYYDAEPPKIEEQNIEAITPTFAKVIAIRGKVSEEADIYVIVNNQTTDKKEYSTQTDENGNFEIQISISQSVLVEVDEQGERTYSYTEVGDFEIENDIILYAVDNAGRESSHINEKIIYQPCGAGEQLDLNIEETMPSMLNPRDLVKGGAQVMIYYTIQESVFTLGTEELNNPALGRPKLGVPPNFGQELIEQYDYDWLRKMNNVRISPTRDALAVYFTFTIPEEIKDEIAEKLGKEWDEIPDFEKENEIYNYATITKPLKILYTIELDYSTIGADGNTEVKTHRTCEELQISIDKPISLGGAVSGNIKTITNFLTGLYDALEGFNQLVNIFRQGTTIGCYGSYVGLGIKWVQTAITCGTNLPNILQKGSNACDGKTNDDKTECEACQDRVKDLNMYRVQWLQNTCHRVSCEQVPSLEIYVQNNKNNPTHPCFGVSYADALGVLDTVAKSATEDSTTEIGKAIAENLLKSSDDGNRWLYRIGDKEKEKYCVIKYHDEFSTVLGLDTDGTNPGILTINYCNAHPDKCGKKEWAYTSKSSICEKINEQVNGYRIELIPRNKQGVSVSKQFVTKDGDPIRIIADIKDNSATVTFGTPNRGGRVTTQTTQSGNIILDNTDFIQPLDNMIYVFDYTSQQSFEQFQNNYESDLKKHMVKDASPIIDFDATFIKQIGTEKRNIIFDSQSSLISSATSLCLPGIESYTAQYANAIGAAQACLVSVSYAGVGNAQSCQELLSTYVCDAIYSVIKCGMDIFIPEPRPVFDLKTDNFKEQVSGGFDQFRYAISQTIQEGTRFGPIGDLQSIISMKGITRGVCLHFFGLDRFDAGSMWTDLMKPDEKIAVAPTIQPIKSQRRFIIFDPMTGNAKYEYSTVVLVSSVTDARIQLDLVCSDVLGCGIGECDCIYGGEETTLLGAIIIKGGESNVTTKYKTITDTKRYDKLRISYNWKNSEGVFVPGDVQEMDLIDLGGTPTICALDELTLEFKCQTGFISQGYAYLVEPVNAYYSNGNINIRGSVVNKFQSADMFDPTKAVVVRAEIIGDTSGQSWANSDSIFPSPNTGFNINLDISDLLPTSKDIGTRVSDTTYVKSVTLSMGAEGEITDAMRTAAISDCGGLYGEWTLEEDNGDNKFTFKLNDKVTINIDSTSKIGTYNCNGNTGNKIVVELNQEPTTPPKTVQISKILTTTADTLSVRVSLYHVNSIGSGPDLTRLVQQQGVQPTVITIPVGIQ